MKKGSEKKTFKASRLVIDKRLDHALVWLLGEEKEKKGGSASVPSRATLSWLVKEGAVTVNGKAVKPHYRLRSGDMVVVPRNLSLQKTHQFSETTTLRPEVVFENNDFAIINKPANLLVHPTRGSSEETLAHFFSASYPEARKVGEDPLRPGIVHRLDRETSGLIVLAKNQDTFLALKKLFQERAVQKTYLALVYGSLPHLSGEINAPLGRKSGKLKRTTIQSEATTRSGRLARTKYRVTKRYGDYDLAAVSPQTGRTHQIRVHFSSIGHPVVGDKLYAFRSHKRGRKEKWLWPARHMLHASGLSFTYAGKKFTFEAPLPADFRRALRDIDESRGSSYDNEALKSLKLE